MPAPSIRWDGATTFQFASGRTRIQAVAAGAFGHQMLYSCIFGLYRVLCTSSELFKLSAKWMMITQDTVIFTKFLLPNSLCRIKWFRWDRRDWMPKWTGNGFRAEYLEADCYSEHSPAWSEGQGWAGAFFSGTFQEAAFITEALSPYCLNYVWYDYPGWLIHFPGDVDRGRGLRKEDYL